ncbi:MAG: hypothetical protein LQ350_008421 [Teloschistes chrysophthalmus]|nr:MAG: hypothetical protein LQ350_008421 [Niorma chrysophthalma]
MKYTTTALSVLTLALSSTSSAQSLTDLPTCALAPATAAFTSSNCGQDIACICKDQNFINSLRPVIERACSPEDFQSTYYPFPLYLLPENSPL